MYYTHYTPDNCCMSLGLCCLEILQHESWKRCVLAYSKLEGRRGHQKQRVSNVDDGGCKLSQRQ